MIVVGVMGPGEDATEQETMLAYELGSLIAQQHWVLLTGGRNVGVMDAASRGAKSAQGLVVGILPGAKTDGISPAVDIPIVTGMHEARDNINVLSSRLLFFVGMSAGTAAELALALKSHRRSILINQHPDVVRVFSALRPQVLEIANDAISAVQLAKQFLGENMSS